jgi:hypothetical protein
MPILRLFRGLKTAKRRAGAVGSMRHAFDRTHSLVVRVGDSS